MDIVKKQPNTDKTNIDVSREAVGEALNGITQNIQEQKDLMNNVIAQTVQTYYTDNGLKAATDNILSHIKDIKPQDHIELMLVTQMIATHNATMKNFNRAAIRSDSSDLKRQELGEANLNLANKLMRTFTTQMEALNRYRGKVQQKMIIEHVNISDGGRAVIGNLTSGKKVEA